MEKFNKYFKRSILGVFIMMLGSCAFNTDFKVNAETRNDESKPIEIIQFKVSDDDGEEKVDFDDLDKKIRIKVKFDLSELFMGNIFVRVENENDGFVYGFKRAEFHGRDDDEMVLEISLNIEELPIGMYEVKAFAIEEDYKEYKKHVSVCEEKLIFIEEQE